MSLLQYNHCRDMAMKFLYPPDREMKTLRDFFWGFINLLYPRVCAACGNSLFRSEELICTYCINNLPRTHFHRYSDTALDKVFWGRTNLRHTTALFYFSKKGRVQHLIHQLKYKGRQDVGIFLGKLLGRELKQDGVEDFQVIIPVPLHPSKQRKRGYNQSELFGKGLSESLGIPCDIDSFRRVVASETQTRKSRFARYENVKEIFRVEKTENIEGKHILLVDDVITTGSTLESCANILLQVPGCQVSVASIAFAVD